MASVISSIGNGSEGVIVTVECGFARSLPNIVIVGYAHRSIDEARERIRGAFASSGIALPRKRIILNLAPADIPKEGSSLDLPMLVSILATAGLAGSPPSPTTAVIGELGLDGSIRPVRGIIGKILAARRAGITDFWIPADNCPQAALIPNLNIYPFRNVKQLYGHLNGQPVQPMPATGPPLPSGTGTDTTFDDVAGQESAKRALVIAAAGNHNVMITGPPGTGKSMLASSLRAIMPELNETEKLETTHLHSLYSKNFDQIITGRPFRAPHHSAGLTAVLGGGTARIPGEVSLSHNGILFFDEIPEFSRTVLEALRQPLEEKKVRLTSTKAKTVLPANFLFIAAANPCPCGFYGTSKRCICLPYQILNYRRKLSGPLLDRIDIFTDAEQVPHDSLLNRTSPRNDTSTFKAQVATARHNQLERSGRLNSELVDRELKKVSALSRDAKQLLNKAAGQIGLTARGYIRTLRVARTIADIQSSQMIHLNHVSEALQYRIKS